MMKVLNIRLEAIKLLEESMGKSSLILVLPMTIDMTAKAKNKSGEPHQIKKLLYSKRNNQHNEMATFGKGGYICKLHT